MPEVREQILMLRLIELPEENALALIGQVIAKEA